VLSIEFAWAQTQGKRAYQEDAAATQRWESGFFLGLLADGMGGAGSGDIASNELLASFTDSFVANDEVDMTLRLEDALSHANTRLREIISSNPETNGMGTTILACAFDGLSAHWLSVGDSPIWLYRDEKLEQINGSHSVMSELMQMVRAGKMSMADVNSHPHRNQLTSAVMGQMVNQVDQGVLKLKEGDYLILASDGVETLTVYELEQLFKANLATEVLAKKIIEEVEQCDAAYQDNATVVVMKIDREKNNE
jgi:protein phosphatase